MHVFLHRHHDFHVLLEFHESIVGEHWRYSVECADGESSEERYEQYVHGLCTRHFWAVWRLWESMGVGINVHWFWCCVVGYRHTSDDADSRVPLWRHLLDELDPGVRQYRSVHSDRDKHLVHRPDHVHLCWSNHRNARIQWLKCITGVNGTRTRS